MANAAGLAVGDEGADALDPRRCAQLVGHIAAEKALFDAYASGRFHHGWLITGVEGVGKASLAWRITRFLQVQAYDAVHGASDLFGGAQAGSQPQSSTNRASLFGDDPALESATGMNQTAQPSALLSPIHTDLDHAVVRRILSGAHDGVRYLKAEADPKTGKMRKEITVAQVRDLLGFFTRTGERDSWRIAIVDAVDHMNRSAANALLKILEEPPEKSAIFLVSHAPGRLLPTIRSRCRTLALSPLSDSDMAAFIGSTMPEVSDKDMTTLLALCDGAPGRALYFHESGAVALLSEVTASMFAAARQNLDSVHVFAASLSSIKNEARYKLVVQIIQWCFSRIIRARALLDTVGADADPASLGLPQGAEAVAATLNDIARLVALEAWLELWDKTRDRFIQLDALNMDRQTVLVSFFNDLAAFARTA